MKQNKIEDTTTQKHECLGLINNDSDAIECIGEDTKGGEASTSDDTTTTNAEDNTRENYSNVEGKTQNSSSNLTNTQCKPDLSCWSLLPPIFHQKWKKLKRWD